MLRRRTLHRSELGHVEDFSAPGECPAPRGHSPEYQLVLPYAGAFEWHAGARTAFLDTTRVLFVCAGEDYADTHVAHDGHHSIIITPHLSVLQELCGHAVPAAHPAFRRVARPATPRMSLRGHRLLHLAGPDADRLPADELMIDLLREAMAPWQGAARTGSLRVVDLAKQFLHAHFREPISLDGIARAVEVSGAYLTDAFARSEGVSLCRYRTRLRLNRALVDLPACGDITRLALDLGFSSHGHFSNAFRSRFGMQPSSFRAEMGRRSHDPARRATASPAFAWDMAQRYPKNV